MNEYEKAMERLMKAYETGDQDYILDCQMEVTEAREKMIKSYEEGE